MAVKKLTFKDFFTIFTTKVNNKKISFDDLRVNYKTLVRVKIHSMGIFLEEINAGTPIKNKDGIAISIELMLTYVNRGLCVELIDDCYMEDIYLLLLLTAELNKDNPSLIESQLKRPIEWCTNYIKNKDYLEFAKMNHPETFIHGNPITKKRIEYLDKVDELKMKVREKFQGKATFDDNFNKKLKDKILSVFEGVLVEKRINPKTGKVEYVKIQDKEKSKAFQGYLQDETEKSIELDDEIKHPNSNKI